MTMVRLTHCAAALLASLSLTMFAADDGRRYNPIIPDTVANPIVVFIDGVFYLYATTDIDKGFDRFGPLVVWKSADFINWSFDGCAYPESTNGLCYAPGSVCRRDDGMYYLTVTVKEGTRIVAGAKPDGPFAAIEDATTVARAGVSRTVCGPFGRMFAEDETQAYMFWRGHNVATMKESWRELGNTRIEIQAPSQDCPDGATIFKRHGLYYYLYTIDALADSRYAYLVSRESPMGEFIVPARDIIARTNKPRGVWGPGQGSVVKVPVRDEYVLVYHEYGEGGATRRVCANTMEFAPDGSILPIELDWQGVGNLTKPAATARNLALGAKATATSCRPGRSIRARFDGKDMWRVASYAATNAVDGSNGTRWWAAETDKKPQLTIDLGSPKQTDRAELFFIFPTLGHAFQLESSRDMRSWNLCGLFDQPEVKSPHVIGVSGTNRYIRVTITKGTPGLWEFRVY